MVYWSSPAFFRSQTLIDTLLNLVFPVDCVLCGEPAREREFGALCRRCAEGFLIAERPFCDRCGYRAPAIEGMCGRCRSGETKFDFGRAALTLDDALRLTIHHFKYNDRVSLARPLARGLRSCLERKAFTSEIVVPVPLHPNRERQRGYNQATLLASGLDLPVRTNLIRRRKNTETQTGLTRSGRRLNIQGAFEVRRPVAGSVLIVDDIRTTGSTINEMAKVLKRNGASRVEVLTLAGIGWLRNQPPLHSEVSGSR